MILVLALLFVLDGVDALVERAMKQLGVPGAAVGVIANGETILARGYGVRSATGKQPVTADTTFALGSVTKSFTSLALATLVDERKLDWDKPVREYYPAFKMHDPVATELINLRDMLSHRSGLPRYDSMRFLVQYPREELVRRLRYLPPSKTFRDVYQYNNLMYVTAGFIGGQVSNSTWEDLVRTRIFAPLGMKSSTVSVVDMQKGSDYAKPHDGGEVEFYDYQRFGVGPNGAVNSNINDMLRYARFYLEDGVVNGKRLLSLEQMRELWRPVTVVSGTTTYALGWLLSNRGGYRQVAHGGSIVGFTANLLLIPEKKIAIVVLNNSASSLPELIANSIADELLGLPKVDYLEQFSRRNPSTPVSTETMAKAGNNDLRRYVGEYKQEAYGTFRIEEKDGELVLITPAVTVPLRMAEGNHRFTAAGWIRGPVTFEAASDGRITGVRLPVESAVAPFAFSRVP